MKITDEIKNRTIVGIILLRLVLLWCLVLYWLGCGASKFRWHWAYVKLMCASYSLDHKRETSMWRIVESLEEKDGKRSDSAACLTRRAFERWIKSPPYEKSAERYPDDCEKYSWAGSYKDICTDLAWHAFRAAYEHSELQMTRVRMGLSKLSRSEHANTRDHAKRLLTLFQESNAPVLPPRGAQPETD